LCKFTENRIGETFTERNGRKVKQQVLVNAKYESSDREKERERQTDNKYIRNGG
jgi:hypothetical protein